MKKDKRSIVKVVREEVVKDNDISIIDFKGKDVNAKVDANKGSTKDEVSAKVSAEVSAKVTDINVI